jgi:hypothetical protein
MTKIIKNSQNVANQLKKITKDKIQDTFSRLKEIHKHSHNKTESEQNIIADKCKEDLLKKK